MQHFDLVIVGGGLVGAGLATALRQSGWRIALVDARVPDNNDPRLFALNASSCQFLQNLGLWPQLAPHAEPIHQVHVSAQGHFGAVRLQREALALPDLGHMIPARFIEAALNAALEKAAHLTLYRPATLLSLRQQQGLATLTINTEAGEHCLQTPLVIGADGTESTVRSQLAIPTKTVEYEQSALVTRTTLQRAHHGIAYERFNKQGAIAMLPLVGNECATIWSADNATISHLAALPATEFLASLQKTFGYRLGRLQQISQRHVFPLRMVRAEKAVDQCVFLLGNAAHTLHPIAAQGFNLALYEVAALTEGVMAKCAKQQPFTAADLQQISEQTQMQQAASIGASHRLSQLFTTDSFWMSTALQLGMLGFELAAPIKRTFIKRIIGRAGRVPRLLLSTNE